MDFDIDIEEDKVFLILNYIFLMVYAPLDECVQLTTLFSKIINKV